MCGIAGYSTIGTNSKVDPRFIEPMIESLHHRGPDESGTAAYPQLAMANARLSIIDLAGGRQPISNADESTVIVYNGELYNTPELTAELKEKGYQFKTRTDTEVLIHLYDEEGIDFVKRLNGMFAFSLYDKKRNRLIVARDRFGVKPLVYSYHNGMLSYASEIKALRVLPDFDTALDPEGISVFLGLFYIPNPWTIYKHVRKLRPGHCLILSEEGLEDREYYDMDFSNKEKITPVEAQDQTAALLRQSIQRQLLSDVPVGVLLSGGLDSRSVLAAASERNPGTTSFTITFSEDLYNEGGEAGFWARLFDSPHKPMLFHEEDFCQQILERQKHMDEPYGLWCNVATGGFARFIHDSGYKVVLSGEGGDELFLGYPTIHAANVARYYHKIPQALRTFIRVLAQRLPAGAGRLPLSFKIKSFVEADSPDLFRTFFGFKEVVRYATWPQLLTPEALKMIGHIDPAIAFMQYRSKVENWHFIDALSYFDYKVFLEGSSFVGNDNAFMASSVESRVPFMDNDLIDFVARLPVNIRFHPYRLKVLLRDALERHFPPPALKNEKLPRYKKNGFEVPTSIWARKGRFGPMLREVLSTERLEKTGFFNPRAVQKLIDDENSGAQNNERILQAIMSLTLFLDGSYALNRKADPCENAVNQ